MRFVNLIIIFFLLNAWTGLNYWSCAGIAIWLWYTIELFESVNKRIAFKEFILVLYGLNYLFSPALAYLLNQNSFYRMKLPEDEYYILAIPCIFLLHIGMNALPTNVLEFDFKKVGRQLEEHQHMLVSWIFAGIGLRFIIPFMPSGLDFLVYLISGIRFVAAFGLFMLDAKRYKWHSLGVLAVELSLSLKNGMFHDTVMWIVFFGLFWVFLKKPSRNLKLALGLTLVFCVYLIQITKSDYRSTISSDSEEAGLTSLQDAVANKINGDEGLFEGSKATTSITRINQAWILASTANRMNSVKDFQQLNLVKRYLESAFLPRLLAPNKLMSGDKQIFNKYSGHRISSSTSMGLGVLADGYIAFGHLGSYAFAFILGLIFALIFKSVEIWSRISPFFILFIFPILNYAVRPDCETQTILGHIVKGLFVYACLASYYAASFSRKRIQAELANERNLIQRIWMRKKPV